MVKVTLRLTEEARRGLDRSARRVGVTLTAMVEAIGMRLDEEPDLLQRHTVDLARRIDAERRARR